MFLLVQQIRRLKKKNILINKTLKAAVEEHKKKQNTLDMHNKALETQFMYQVTYRLPSTLVTPECRHLKGL